jgi:hypothetical protein
MAPRALATTPARLTSVRPSGSIVDERGARGLGRRGRARTQRDHDVAHAAVAQIVGVPEPLTAITDHRDVLTLDQVQIGVGVV